jgi:hypothetical protein
MPSANKFNYNSSPTMASNFPVSAGTTAVSFTGNVLAAVATRLMASATNDDEGINACLAVESFNA